MSKHLHTRRCRISQDTHVPPLTRSDCCVAQTNKEIRFHLCYINCKKHNKVIIFCCFCLFVCFFFFSNTGQSVFNATHHNTVLDIIFPNKPSHEIMALFVLHKLILQTCMHSHPVGLDVWFLVGPFVYFVTSCVPIAKALARLRGCTGSPEPSLVAYVISTIISGVIFFVKLSLYNTAHF